MENHTRIAAAPAIRDARALVDVLVFGAVAIVVFIVAQGIVVGGLDARVLANAVVVEIVPTGDAASASASSRHARRNAIHVASNADGIGIQ